MNENMNKFGYVMLLIGVILGFFVLPEILMYISFKSIFQPSEMLMGIMRKSPYVLEVFVFFILTLIFTGVYWSVFRKKESVHKESLTAKKMLLMVIVGFGISGISLLWISLAKNIPMFQKSIEAMNKTNDTMAGSSPVGTFLLAVILAPILEEVVFRGIIFRSVENIANSFWAIIVSAILFGVFHMNLAQFVFTIIMGMISALVYMKTRNLFYSIVIHFGHNFIGGIQGFAFFKDSGEMLDIFTLIMVIPMAYIVYRLLNKNVKPK